MLEREVKLEAEPGFALPKLPGEPRPERTFESLYFDTADARLRRAGAAGGGGGGAGAGGGAGRGGGGGGPGGGGAGGRGAAPAVVGGPARAAGRPPRRPRLGGRAAPAPGGGVLHGRSGGRPAAVIV